MAARRKDGPTESHHLLIIMAAPRASIPHHLDPGIAHGDKGDGHAMARRDRPTDYEREQQREIDEDYMAAGGRKKRKKGGRTKGLTAHHRMDHQHRRAGGRARLQQAGTAGPPGLGATPGMPQGAGGLPPTMGAGAAPIGQMGAGAVPPIGGPPQMARGVTPASALAAQPRPVPAVGGGPAGGLGGGAGMPGGGTAMPPGGTPATAAGVRPPGMARGGKLPKALAKRKYNGVEPPQDRERHQRGGGLGFRAAPMVARPVIGGYPGRGVGDPHPAATGIGGMRAGRGSRAPMGMNPRMPGGARAPALLAAATRGRGMQAGGDVESEDDYDPNRRTVRLEVSDGERPRGGEGGRGRTRGSRFGEKWIQGHGVEATDRVDRSRGSPILEDDLGPSEYDPGIDRFDAGEQGRAPGKGPDDNLADDTGPAFDNRDFVARGGRLTARQRQSLPSSDFALPGRGSGPKGAGSGSYPIPDRSHAQNALARVSQHGTSAEKRAVRAKVHAKYPDMGK